MHIQRLRCGRGFDTTRRRLARRIAKIAQEIRIRPQHQVRIAVLHDLGGAASRLRHLPAAQSPFFSCWRPSSATARWNKERVEAFPVRKSLCHSRSLFPGNVILRSGDSGVEKARHIQPSASRDKTPARKTASSAPICMIPENLCLYRTAWWSSADSNLQPSDYQPLVLSLSNEPACGFSRERPRSQALCLKEDWLR